MNHKVITNILEETMKLYQYKETIIMVIIMLICIFMGIHSYQEDYIANVIKWAIILGMTVVLYVRYLKKKKNSR